MVVEFLSCGKKFLDIQRRCLVDCLSNFDYLKM